MLLLVTVRLYGGLLLLRHLVRLIAVIEVVLRHGAVNPYGNEENYGGNEGVEMPDCLLRFFGLGGVLIFRQSDFD